MTTISATPNDTTGSVALEITKTATVSKIVRTNVNGSEEVRATQGQLPSAGTGTLILSDYEASHGLNTYNAYVDEYITRTNQAKNPRPKSTSEFVAGYVTGSGTFSYQVSSPADYVRITKDGTLGTSHISVNDASTTLSSGAVVSGRAMIRSSAGVTVTLRNSSTVMDGVPTVYLEPNTWTPIIFNGYAITGTTFRLSFWAQLQAAATFDLKEVMWEVAPTSGEYFHGSQTSTADVTYAWTGSNNLSTSTETTHVQQVTTSAVLNIDKPWLSVPVMPQYSEQFETITAYEAGREANTTIHRPLGRADNLVVMGKLGDRTGRLEIFCNSYAEARKLERVFERGEVVQLRQSVEGMDMYFTVTSIPVAPYSVVSEAATRWAMTVNYVEVRRPIGALAGALGWTFNELGTSFASFNAVTPAFTDFDSLTLGDGIV